jgi:hypothetical protein
MRKVIVDERMVASASEMRKLDNLDIIQIYTPTNPRHKFFHDINIAPYQAYKGPWGNEHIRWDGNGGGYVRVTPDRFREIQQVIIKSLYEGNE